MDRKKEQESTREIKSNLQQERRRRGGGGEKELERCKADNAIFW